MRITGESTVTVYINTITSITVSTKTVTYESLWKTERKAFSSLEYKEPNPRETHKGHSKQYLAKVSISRPRLLQTRLRGKEREWAPRPSLRADEQQEGGKAWRRRWGCRGVGCGQGERTEPRGAGRGQHAMQRTECAQPSGGAWENSRRRRLTLLSSPHPSSLKRTRGKASLREVPSLHVEQRSSPTSQDTGRRRELQQTGRAQPPGHCTDLTLRL